jgi:hypothetical protein
MLKTRAGLTVRRFVAPRHRRGRLPFFGRFRAQMSGNSWRYLGYLGVNDVVYEKDLGPNASTSAAGMGGVHKDATWRAVDESRLFSGTASAR